VKNDGMSLEDEVFQLVKKMLDSEDLPYRKALCRFHRRKSYYSPDRKGDVDFENVLEV